MRLRISLTILQTLGIAAIALAGPTTDLGTKANPVSTNAQFQGGGPGLMPLFQMLIVTGVVLFLLKSMAPKFIAKLNKKLVTNLNGGIKIEESASFAGGSLYVIEARKKTLLLSVGANGVQCLADLSEPKAEPLPVFADFVETEAQKRGESLEPVQPAAHLEDEPVSTVEWSAEELESDPKKQEALAALQRLRRFSV